MRDPRVQVVARGLRQTLAAHPGGVLLLLLLVRRRRVGPAALPARQRKWRVSRYRHMARALSCQTLAWSPARLLRNPPHALAFDLHPTLVIILHFPASPRLARRSILVLLLCISLQTLLSYRGLRDPGGLLCPP